MYGRFLEKNFTLTTGFSAFLSVLMKSRNPKMPAANIHGAASLLFMEESPYMNHEMDTIKRRLPQRSNASKAFLPFSDFDLPGILNAAGKNADTDTIAVARKTARHPKCSFRIPPSTGPIDSPA